MGKKITSLFIAATTGLVLTVAEAKAFSWEVSLGSEAKFRLLAIENGVFLGIGQIELGGETWNTFDKVTNPIVNAWGVPLPNVLAVVRPVFYEKGVDDGDSQQR